MPSPAKPFQILVVDDHAPTAKLISSAFEETSDIVVTHVVSRGQDCLDELQETNGRSQLPDFVLLDLGLPDIDGFEVLEAIRSNPATRHLPVVVLSGQSDEQTINRCYQEGANTFMAKPDDYDEYLTLAELIVDYWRSGAQLPARTVCS